MVADTADGRLAFKLVDYGFATRIGEQSTCRTTNLLTCASSQLEDNNLALAEGDSESLMYVLLGLAGITLPWASAAASGDIQAVSLSLLRKTDQNRHKQSVFAHQTHETQSRTLIFNDACKRLICKPIIWLGFCQVKIPESLTDRQSSFRIAHMQHSFLK